jgi:hypothetical protein
MCPPACTDLNFRNQSRKRDPLAKSVESGVFRTLEDRNLGYALTERAIESLA